MNDQVLNIERMQHLKELGVDTSKASMYWVRIVRPATRMNEKERVMLDWMLHLSKEVMHTPLDVVRTIPTFTLQDILDLLPKKLQHRYEDYELTLFYSHESYDWKVQYLNENVSFMDYKSGEELIDATYQMLCWCIEQGYVETKKEE